MNIKNNEIIRFISKQFVYVSILSSNECKKLIIEEQATSKIPDNLVDLFPQKGFAEILDENGNVIDKQFIPKKKVLTTKELMAYYPKKRCFRYENVKQIFLKNTVIQKILDLDSYRAILFHSYQDYRACYRKTNVSLNEHNDIIISTVDHDLDKVTLNNFLRSNEAQLLAAFTDEYYKAYALKDGYYLVVHYDREKPSTSLFNDYEAFKDYVAILPPLV